MSDESNRSPFAPPTAPVAPPPEPPATEVVAAPPTKRRPTGRIIGAGVAVVALVAAAGFAISRIGDSSNAGGAASAAEAGEHFVSALNDEDILGVVDLLLPGERDTFRQPMLDAVDNFKRLGILSSDADPSKVTGLDIDLEDVRVTADRPVADDIDTVRIRATDNTSIDGNKLPLGDLLLREAFGGKQPDQTSSTDGAPVDLRVTTVEQGGRWYVSLFYSIAESTRDGATDVPAEPVALAGAADPEDAVDQMIRSIARFDLAAIVGGLNPHEAEALQRYAPLFLGDAQRQLDRQDLKIDVSKAEYDVEGSGDHRLVSITAFEATATANGDSVTVGFADGCVTMTGSGDDQKFCSGDVSGSTARGLADDPELKALVDSITAAFSDAKASGIAVDQVDGKWFVSPIGTGADAFIAVLKALDKDELADIIDKARAFGSSVDTGGINLPELGGVLNTP